MRALTVRPGQADSARVEDVPEPPESLGPVLVQALAVGVCGTDREIARGKYGWAPPGKDRLVLGHESLGRVLDAPTDSGLKPGDLVAGIVRRPDPVPCPNCAAGEWDMCRNGKYTEHGIKELDGFCAERWRVHPDHAVKVPPQLGHLGVLIEPASVVAKAWEHVERIGRRAVWQPRTCLVTGAGPIGLLAALMGRQRGLEVHVLDHHTEGPKPQLVKDLGARYHTSAVGDLAAAADVVVECTGVGPLVIEIVSRTPPGCITCLTGISSGGHRIAVDMAALNKEMVLENDVVFGTVNANRRHYELGASALAKADPKWLARVVTRRVQLADWKDALVRRPDDVKTVIELAAQ
ncbi:MAG: glucose 1-dehydrogenase [Zavarzinella sp.]|nr:glucose 1-dehydrogenase [Zavarzinella sp.]